MDRPCAVRYHKMPFHFWATDLIGKPLVRLRKTVKRARATKITNKNRVRVVGLWIRKKKKSIACWMEKRLCRFSKISFDWLSQSRHKIKWNSFAFFDTLLEFDYFLYFHQFANVFYFLYFSGKLNVNKILDLTNNSIQQCDRSLRCLRMGECSHIRDYLIDPLEPVNVIDPRKWKNPSWNWDSFNRTKEPIPSKQSKHSHSIENNDLVYSISILVAMDTPQKPLN